MQPISLQEVKLVVNEMIDGTMLGPDCFTINFLHYYWNLLKYNVLELVEEENQKQWVLPALNSTHLTLVL